MGEIKQYKQGTKTETKMAKQKKNNTEQNLMVKSRYRKRFSSTFVSSEDTAKDCRLDSNWTDSN